MLARNLRIVFLLSLFVFARVFGGNDPDKEDSLIIKLLSVKEGPEKVDIMLELASYYTQDNVVKSEEFAKHALELSQEINYRHGLAQANFLMAQLMLDYDLDLAEYFLVQSMEQAEKLSDIKLKGKLTNMIGVIKSNNGLMDEALDYFGKAIDIFKSNGMDSLISPVYNNIGIAYSRYDEDSLSITYYRKAAALNKQFGKYDYLAINYNNIADQCLHDYNFTGAMHYLDSCLIMFESGTIHNQYLLSYVYNNISSYHFLQDDFPQALKFARLSNSMARKMKNRDQEGYSFLKISQSMEKMGRYDSAFYYYLQYSEVRDSLVYDNKISEIEMMETQYQFKTELELNLLRSRNQNIIYLSVISVLILVTGLIYSLFRSQRLKTVKNQIENEKLELEKHKLMDEVNLKSRELTTKLMLIAGQNLMIGNVIERLKNPRTDYSPENQRVVDRVIMELKQNQNANAWREFEKEFMAVHPDFYRRIGSDFPELTLNDLRLCALLKLNMTTKEISDLTRTSVGSIEKARTRLRNRLGLTGSDQSIISFISRY